ncbi:MAG: hypothetical protein PHC83_02905 [Bacteroidales bacterium]|jgi:uncharacterized protein YkuJ|nr:hypothetical protein [Bacteroidales bacterium]MDD4209103.1 hypothetical protein [Bacteroidales bacterium]MDY0015337.1 hypothetical protein [Bacteroidales bacterium]
MKKYIILTSVLILSVVLITSCDKEGMYKPGQKISKIYYQYSAEGETSGKMIDQIWTWEGGKLVKINYIQEGESAVMEYDGNQLIGVIGEYYYMSFVYKTSLLGGKKELEKMEYYDGGELAFTANFTYDGNKITKISIVAEYDEYDYDYASEKTIKNSNSFARIMRLFLSEPIVKRITENIQKSKAVIQTYDLTYDGNNIISIIYNTGESFYNLSYTYDDKKNPFYDALFVSGDNPVLALSENNIQSEAVSSSGYSSIQNYTYVYEGNWPTQQTYIYEDEYYTYTITTFYEYE